MFSALSSQLFAFALPYRSTRRSLKLKLPAVPGSVFVVSTTNSSVSASAGSNLAVSLPTGVMSLNGTTDVARLGIEIDRSLPAIA